MNDTRAISPIELIAAFESGFMGLTPTELPKASLAQRLEPLRECILERRKRGFSWKQIAQVLRQPKIGLIASPVTLRKLFNEKPRSTRRSATRITSLRVLPPETTAAAPAK